MTTHSQIVVLILMVWGVSGGVRQAHANLKMAASKADTTVAPWKGVKVPLEKKGNCALPSGFNFDAVLSNAIFSYNLLTPAIAVTEEDITFLGEVVVPKDTKLIGTVQAVHSLNRINIAFNAAVFPDGQEIAIHAMALSPDGSAGVVGVLETHKDSMAAKTAMRTIFSGVSTVASASPAPSVGSALAANLSNEAAGTIDTGGAKELDSIRIEPKAPIKVFFMDRTEY